MTVWRGARPLLLASTSRTRLRLLEAAGLPVESEAPDVDERALEAAMGDEEAGGIALRLAVAKAESVASRHPDRIVLGADQVLELDGRTWPKPASRTEAAVQLRRLSGRRHRLHTAFRLAAPGGVAVAGAATADLTMRALDDRDIDAYLDAAGEVATRSAGGYEIEALGIHLFDRIDGEHSTILGLPLLPLLAALRRLELLAL